jgi:modulator of FtsH protease HflK
LRLEPLDSGGYSTICTEGRVESAVAHPYRRDHGSARRNVSARMGFKNTERTFMPWNDKSGGGGPWGGGNGNGGGPWGQGPRPSGPQGSPPDLEDIIRRGQDRLKQALPGGGRATPALFGLIALGLVALWLFQAIYTVQPDQLAVELRFGKPKEELSQPGLHFHWWPIETVEYANTAEKLVDLGEVRGNTSSGLMLSGDQNIVDVKFSIAYQVSNPEAYLFNVANPDDMVRQIGESAMREAVGKRPAQDIFRDDRQGIADTVRQIIQTTLDQYGTGLSINAISIEDAAPPREVADAFDEVQRAEQDEDRFVEESNQYSNQKLGQARGESAQIREEAAAYKNRVVQEAEGEAQRFISVYDEYAKAPEVTRERLFIETMEKVLKDSNKVIIEQGSGQGVVPYLPLPELAKRAPAEGAN